MRWAVLNPVHCNRTQGGRSRSPAFLQNAVCLHDCHCAGGRWQLRITAPSDNTYCLYFLFNIYQEDKKPKFIVLHVEDVKTLKPNWVKKWLNQTLKTQQWLFLLEQRAIIKSLLSVWDMIT